MPYEYNKDGKWVHYYTCADCSLKYTGDCKHRNPKEKACQCFVNEYLEKQKGGE